MPVFSAHSKRSSAPHPRLAAHEVVRCLDPHLSASRKRRIERVVRQRLCGVTLVLERPHDPHNGAAALRTAEAMGLLDVHIIRGEDGFNFSRKVTIDAHKWLNVYLHDDTDRCLSFLRDCGYGLWAAVPPRVGSVPVQPGIELAGPVALVFGNEHAGLTETAKSVCDRPFHLPMHGFTESFNLSVSVALGLSPVVGAYRERMGPGDLPPEEADQLRAAYYARSTPHVWPLLKNHVNSVE